MKLSLLLVLLTVSGCGSMPTNPSTIAAGAPGQIDYCVTVLGTNFFCINATRKMATADSPDAE